MNAIWIFAGIYLFAAAIFYAYVQFSDLKNKRISITAFLDVVSVWFPPVFFLMALLWPIFALLYLFDNGKKTK